MVITYWCQGARFWCIACLQSQQWTQNVKRTDKGNWELTLHVKLFNRGNAFSVAFEVTMSTRTHLQRWDNRKIWIECGAPSWQCVRHVPPSKHNVSGDISRGWHYLNSKLKPLPLLLIFNTVRKPEECLQCCGHKHYDLHMCLENHRR